MSKGFFSSKTILYLQDDSSDLGLFHVRGDGGASLLVHHLLSLGMVLPFEEVVDAHVHEGSRVNVAECGAKSRSVLQEEGSANSVGRGGLKRRGRR